MDVACINRETITAARREGRDLYREAKDARFSLLVLNAEQLRSPDFQRLLSDATFRQDLVLCAVDEVHLVDQWGEDFRKAFGQIGLSRARMPGHVVLLAQTATLTKPSRIRVCSSLGLREGHYYFLRRSCERPNIALIRRQLTTAVSSNFLPDLEWIMSTGRKTLIYVPNIAVGFHVLCTLMTLLPPGAQRSRRIRMYNKLNWPDYNEETLRLFAEDPLLQVIICTDALMVGINMRNVADVVVVGLPKNLEELLQKLGRAARDLAIVRWGRGIFYFPRSVFAQARPPTARGRGSAAQSAGKGKAVKTAEDADGEGGDQTKDGKKKKPLDVNIARLARATGCLSVEING